MIRDASVEVNGDDAVKCIDENGGEERGEDRCEVTGEDKGDDRDVVALLPKEKGSGGGHTLKVMLVHAHHLRTLLGLPNCQSAHETVPRFGNSACDTSRSRNGLGSWHWRWRAAIR